MALRVLVGEYVALLVPVVLEVLRLPLGRSDLLALSGLLPLALLRALSGLLALCPCC